MHTMDSTSVLLCPNPRHGTLYGDLHELGAIQSKSLFLSALEGQSAPIARIDSVGASRDGRAQNTTQTRRSTRKLTPYQIPTKDPYEPDNPKHNTLDASAELVRLLRHKLQGTLPTEAFTTARQKYRLHEKVKEQIRMMKSDARYEKRMSYQARREFEHLKDLVWQWGDNGEWTKTNRLEIKKVVRVLQLKRTLPRITEGEM